MRWAVICCAGESNRFGSDKLNASLFGRTVAVRSVQLFCGIADKIVVVCSQENMQGLQQSLPDDTIFVVGGKTRTQSVANGLACCEDGVVAIHDGARPFCSVQLIERAYSQAEQHKSAVPCVSPVDCLTLNGMHIDKNQVKLIQTPQVFDTQMLKNALSNTTDSFADESTVWQKVYNDVNYIEGEQQNKKITFSSDLPCFKVGYGYDLHTLAPQRKLILGGVAIQHEKGLVGHSDADVVAHSLMDAILSAAGKNDIGHYFPPTDQKYKDADSMMLLRETLEIAEVAKTFCLESVSIAIVAEKPRLSPYLSQMKKRLSATLMLPESAIGISVTTAEGIGEIGRGQAIASRCCVLLSKI